jgi:oxygen-independent coproporphyrinogen III oxidase
VGFPAIAPDLIERYGVQAPRYTSYPTVPIWSESLGPAEYARALRAAGSRVDEPLSLYVHIPFCEQLCTFCGCSMVVLRSQGQVEAYLRSLEEEIALVAEALGDRRQLLQIHWGGGTPTSLDEEQIERLWRAITRHFTVAEGAEVAIEIDPAVTRPSQITRLRALGFNRLSLGIQDLDPKVQQTVNRIQSAEDTEALLRQARALGFKGLNVDLIYGLPYQTPATWTRTLERVLAMEPDRAAVYSFAYVPQVKHQQRLLPFAALPMGRDKLELFKLAYEAFEGAGFQPIGMDHFARPDDELTHALERRTLRRNFQGYTAAQVGEVVAFGATGISDIGGVYAQNVRPLPRYEASVGGGHLATERGYRLSPDDRMRREVIQQLMCNAEVDLGCDAGERFAGELVQLRGLERDGLLEILGSKVAVTSLGRVFIRNIAMVFDAHLNAPSRYSQTI